MNNSNLTVRVMRALDETHAAPEYANNQLMVELLSATPLTDTSELSIRIFSSRYQLMATDTWQHNSSKAPRRIRFRLLSETYWDDSHYHLFVYRNGHPRWYTALTLHPGYAVWRKAVLHEPMECPDEMFFANHLSISSYWPKLVPCRFSIKLIRELIRKLRIRANTPTALPHMLAVGDGTRANAFASYILAGYVSHDNVKERFHCSLDELSTGRARWTRLTNDFEGKKAIVMKVTPLDDNNRTTNILEMLADLLRSNRFANTAFLLHGTPENIEQLFQRCPSLAGLFDGNNTFHITMSESPDVDDTLCDADSALPSEHADIDAHSMQHATQHSPGECPASLKLQKLVGLKRLKADMQDACLMAQFVKERRELCLDLSQDNRHHMLFYGNPGTGKTTVAKLVGEMYHHMGLLSSGHTVETCRTELVGEYIGHTEKRMREIIDKAKGGVLFIDEAYTLIDRSQDSNDFGKEVINSLLTLLSVPDPDMIVIMAGYEDKMQDLLKTNPGLKDRFPLQFHFEDYTAEELMEIARINLQERHFILTPDAALRLNQVITETAAQRNVYFGNGRWVHNFIEQGLIKSMARRIMSMSFHDSADRILLSTIEPADVDDAEERLLRNERFRLAQPARIGFRA